MKKRVSEVLLRLLAVIAILAVPAVASAQQEATLSGTVTDSSGGVLPGVTVTAVSAASGNTFVGVTDERGNYRVPMRIGAYQVTVELSGFATVTRTVNLLVGQQVVADLRLVPGGVTESVTVTGEAPLLDTAQSSLAANIDPKQMTELPVNGRNWLALTLLAPGSKANSISPLGGPTSTIGTFRINVDGQDVTGNCCGTGHQAGFSRDAIAEFEFISNRFDATQGRSAGVQVNVITKSGTNRFAGGVSGYFRDAGKLKTAKDFLTGTVLPYSNQQVAGSFGGPILRDKLHFFINYEREREPTVIVYDNPAYPRFRLEEPITRTDRKAAFRVDAQFTPRSRFSVRGSAWEFIQPDNQAGGAGNHPSVSATSWDYSDNISGTLTQVLSSRTVNEVKVGWAGIHWQYDPNVNWSKSRGDAMARPGFGTPNIQLTGYTIGTTANYGERLGQDGYSFRDDLSFTYNKMGNHTLKVGGEYQRNNGWLIWCNFYNTRIVANARPVPANIQDLFPVWNNPDTWNINALSAITSRVQVYVGDCTVNTPRNTFGGWAQDDWAITERLTLNLGLRADRETGAFANELEFKPFLEANRPNRPGISPRLGMAYRLADQTVLRGGFGTFYSQVINTAAYPLHAAVFARIPEIPNDGRPDFALNPFNGPIPNTVAEIDAQACNVNNRPGCVRRSLAQGIPDPNSKIPFAYQTSVGVQQQIGADMAVDVNYVYTGLRNSRGASDNVNLLYNPATGVNYPLTDLVNKPFPDWGTVLITQHGDYSNYHGLETSFTKRFSNRWQAQATYTLGRTKEGTPPPLSGLQQVTFPLAEDLGATYGLAVNDQRHRAVFNGIWDAGYGFQVSGLYFYGSGERRATTFGGDRRLTGATGARVGRLRADGTITPLNNFVGDPLHRVDMRIQRGFSLGGTMRIDGLFELFNVFNHENYGTYTTQESNASYGKPAQNTNVAFQPRMVQLGFRLAF